LASSSGARSRRPGWPSSESDGSQGCVPGDGPALWTASPPPVAGAAPPVRGGELWDHHHVGRDPAQREASAKQIATAQTALVGSAGQSVPAQPFGGRPSPSSRIDDDLSGRPRRAAEATTDQRPDAWAAWSAHDDDCRGAAGRAGAARPVPMRSFATGWARVGADPVDRTFGAAAGRAGNLTSQPDRRGTAGHASNRGPVRRPRPSCWTSSRATQRC
jgi:hypothetical protein